MLVGMMALAALSMLEMPRPLPKPIPLTVLAHAGPVAWSDTLDALLDLKPRAVVFDFPLTAGSLGEQRGAFERFLAQRGALPVHAVSEPGQDLFPRCGQAPCLDGLMATDRMMELRLSEGPHFEPCPGGEASLPSALALLLGPEPNSSPLDRCGRYPLVMPPVDPCDRPWSRLWTEDLLGEPVEALDEPQARIVPSCGSPQVLIPGRVVLVSDPGPQKILTLQAPELMSLTHAELNAALAWSLGLSWYGEGP